MKLQRKSDSGGHSGSKHIASGLFSTGLVKIACKTDTPKEQIVRERDPMRRGHPQTLLTDEQVREARKLHEQDGKTAQDILQMYPSMTKQYVRKLLTYEVRSRIFP